MMAIGYVFMCLVFGTTYLAIKFGINEGMPPILMAGLRFLIASVLVLAYCALKREKFPKGWRAYAELAFLGLLMTTIPFTALFWAEAHISSGTAALLVATAPVCIGLFSRMDRWQWLGVGIALTGLYLIVAPDLGQTGGDSWKSLLAKVTIVAGEFFFAWGAIRSKKFMAGAGAQIGANLFNGLQMLFASVGILLVSLFTEPHEAIPLNGVVISSLLYLAVVASIFASGVYYWLVRVTNPLFPTTWTYLAPILALAAGALFLGEPVTGAALLGTMLVVGGVLVLNRQIFRHLLGKNTKISS